MIKIIKESIRAKFTLMFIGILCFSCICSFGIVYLFAFNFIKSTILNISLNYTNEQLKQILLLIIITLIICAIIGSTLMYFATKFISKPIKYVSNSTKEVSKGNFNGFIDYDSDDEIGVLAKNFNLMTSELKNMEYLRKDFISNVSHEFKTPIASIHGFVEMIKDKNLPEGKRDEYIDIIIEETERLSHLSSNMLKISRLDNQSIPNKIVTFSLDEQIRKIILLLENKWSEKNLELDINLEKIIFKGDEELIQQIWINLIENSIKFSEQRGVLSVGLKNFEDNIVVKLSDTGIGISEENKKRVFERFYQGDASHSKEGNGLGLTIVKRIVEICNGRIEIESTLGKGATFIIVLPKY